MQEHKLLIDGEWVSTGSTIEILNPYTNEPAFCVAVAGRQEITAAIDAASKAFPRWSETAAHERARVLYRTAELLEERKEEIARTIALEGGKPIRDARGEVGRAVQTFRFAAEEAKRSHGETIPMDAALGSEKRMGLTIRQPIGVIAAISPFNFPLNLVAHKVAPALATGNTVILKPAEQTPVTALLLGEILVEAGVPAGVVNILNGEGPRGWQPARNQQQGRNGYLHR